MLKFGKKTQYALVALFHLDRVTPPGARVSTHDLSTLYGIPEPHLGKVLQKLSKAGLLKAVQGVQGGYELVKSPSELTLGDIVSALEPNLIRRRGKQPLCDGPFPPCRVRGLADNVERRALEHLYQMTLADLSADSDLSDAYRSPFEPTLEMTS